MGTFFNLFKLLFFFRQKMDEFTGNDPNKLRNLVQKWAKNCPTQLESPVFGQIPLICFVDHTQSECLNEHNNHSLSVILLLKYLI